ncbi:hypothetical protein [Pseudomonas reinekei]|uniref:Type I restriction endonuclease subunit M n=2 Tax=Pseudomonas reinekei TaxID=395598 RepID=A0A1Q9WSD1_PSERE|nr:hypothetical protein [Pseudomonas reinekei]KAB0484858.1 hypothetical protein F7R15_16260 [Pseudomonas reinekei]OLU01668.1 hypothetical protein BVK86_18150 [Pseudomonas reinekei]
MSISPKTDAITKPILGPKRNRFSPGKILATPKALAAMEEKNLTVFTLLSRHLSGDWGSVLPEYSRSNDEALIHGFRLLSIYVLGPDTTIWVITEADRSATTFLLPSEY